MVIFYLKRKSLRTTEINNIQSLSRILWILLKVWWLSLYVITFAVVVLNAVSSKCCQTVYHPYYYINSSSIVCNFFFPRTIYHINFILNFNHLSNFIFHNTVKSNNIFQMPFPKYLSLKSRYAIAGQINSIPSLSFMKCNMLV